MLWWCGYSTLLGRCAAGPAGERTSSAQAAVGWTGGTERFAACISRLQLPTQKGFASMSQSCSCCPRCCSACQSVRRTDHLSREEFMGSHVRSSTVAELRPLHSTALSATPATTPKPLREPSNSRQSMSRGGKLAPEVNRYALSGIVLASRDLR